MVLAFNSIDDAFAVDRRSFVNAYKIIQGVPRNPVRRTGLEGRGNLLRWGPNHEVEIAVTRWARNESGTVKQKNNMPVLEVLVLINNNQEVRCAVIVVRLFLNLRLCLR